MRAAEAGFAAASARANAAHDRAATVQALIASAEPAHGETRLAALRGGASLRALLRPALDAAASRAHAESRARQSAADRLADTSARHDRTQRDLADAQSLAERDAEDRESGERPQLRRQ